MYLEAWQSKEDFTETALNKFNPVLSDMLSYATSTREPDISDEVCWKKKKANQLYLGKKETSHETITPLSKFQVS